MACDSAAASSGSVIAAARVWAVGVFWILTGSAMNTEPFGTWSRFSNPSTSTPPCLNTPRWLSMALKVSVR